MLLAEAYGEIGGWKVGAPSADATPMFAPMPTVWIAPSGTTFRALRYRGLEAEVAFRMGRDLPPRTDAYTRDEVLAAVSSCHPAIEILESGLTDPGQADRLSMIADLQMHGGFVYGPAYADWRSVDFSAERVVLSVEGMVRVERTGSNTAGDLLRLLPWLANEGAARTGGLRAGQWITTGSWTGNLQAGERSTVDVTFSTLGRVETRFEPEQELEKGLPGAAVRSFP
jgi:2-keto-4-pentenoate hydratase